MCLYNVLFFKYSELILIFFKIIEWELRFKNTKLLLEEEVESCRKGLSDRVNEELFNSKLQDFFIADHQLDIRVTKSTLFMRFSVGNTSIPDIDYLTNIIGRFLKKIAGQDISIRNGKNVSR